MSTTASQLVVEHVGEDLNYGDANVKAHVNPFVRRREYRYQSSIGGP